MSHSHENCYLMFSVVGMRFDAAQIVPKNPVHQLPCVVFPYDLDVFAFERVLEQSINFVVLHYRLFLQAESQ
jgi:hypothetical protein